MLSMATSNLYEIDRYTWVRQYLYLTITPHNHFDITKVRKESCVARMLVAISAAIPTLDSWDQKLPACSKERFQQAKKAPKGVS